MKFRNANETLNELPLEKFIAVKDNTGCHRMGNFYKEEDDTISFSVCGTEMYESFIVPQDKLWSIEWLDEEFDTDAEFVERLIEELPAYGIDTSMWEYNYGDCCDSAIEFIARAFNGVQEHDEV